MQATGNRERGIPPGGPGFALDLRAVIAQGRAVLVGGWDRDTARPAAARGASPQRWEVAFLVAYFPLLALSQWLFAYYDAGIGVAVALVLVVGLYVAVSLAPFGPAFMRSADSLALVPLYVLLTASLPWFYLDQDYLIPAVYAIVIALCLWHLQSRGLRFGGLKELGFNGNALLVSIVIGVALAVPMGMTEYFILRPEAPSPTFDLSILLRDAVYMLLFVALGEELLFRAIIQRDLSETLSWTKALLLTSVLFGIMHLTWRTPEEVMFTFGAGMLLGYLYFRTRSLTAPIVLHGMNNLLLVSVMPYLFG